jgi:ABC-type iron transport system FetAB ATPase subunit
MMDANARILFERHLQTVDGRRKLILSMCKPFNTIMQNPEKFAGTFQELLMGALEIRNKASEYEWFEPVLSDFHGHPKDLNEFIETLSGYAEAPEVAMIMLS